MTGGKPELVIPVKWDIAEALMQLRGLEAQGKQATAETAKGARGAEDAHKSLADSILGVNLQMQAMSVGKQAIDAVGQSAVEAANRVEEMAQRFISLRDRARELAGVMGQKGDLGFAREQIQFAADVGMTPEQAVQFRGAFQGEAQQYKGRFQKGQYEEFEKLAAQYANQMGLPADVAAKIAGMAVRTGATEGQTASGTLARLGAAFKTMQAGSGDNPVLAGQLAQMSGMVGPENAFPSLEEAAVSVRVAAETNQSEAYTKASEIRQGVVELTTSDKHEADARALGITATSTNLDAVKALSEAQEKSGEPVDVFLKRYFNQIRIRNAFRDFIRAYRGGVVSQGRADAVMAPGEIERGVADYLADPSQAGMLAQERARTQLAEAGYSEERALVEPYLEHARGTTVAQRNSRFARFMENVRGVIPFADTYGKSGGWEGTEALEYWTAYRDVRGQAQQAGANVSGINPGWTASQQELTHAIAELVRLTREANEQRRRPDRQPLSAPPPNPATR